MERHRERFEGFLVEEGAKRRERGGPGGRRRGGGLVVAVGCWTLLVVEVVGIWTGVIEALSIRMESRGEGSMGVEPSGKQFHWLGHIYCLRQIQVAFAPYFIFVHP